MDLTVFTDEYSSRYIEPTMRAVADRVDAELLKLLEMYTEQKILNDFNLGCFKESANESSSR